MNIIKRVAPEIHRIYKIHEIVEVIYGVTHVESYRTRKIWAIKRSPHVFNKSQETFGYEVYHGVMHLKSNWPISIKSIITSLAHLVPGVEMSWFTK